jgi:Holliday junction resolvase RusA-like endonuclease
VTHTVFVPGDPVPQGSMRGFARPGGQVSIVASNRRFLAEWRAQMSAYIRRSYPEAVAKTGKFAVKVEFHIRRPSSHYLPVNSRRPRPELRKDAPMWVERMPDIDKLARAVLDASTDAGVWNDDAQVVHLTASKKYANDPSAVGVTITYSGGT